MAVIDRPIVLPKLAFLTAWSMLAVGDLPSAFGTNLHHWTSADGRRELEVRAMTALTDLGLARNNRLNGLWRSTATVLARAGREYYSFSNFADGRACSVLIAARGEDALRVVIDDNVVSLEPIEDKWLATALLDTLPEVTAAVTPPAVVPHAVYEGQPASGETDGRDLERLQTAMQRPRQAVHQIYVARRDADGERIRSLPITAIDIAEAGRLLVYTDADDNIVMIPATAREFVSTLNNTYTDL
ncbi:ESX secretion-associated protein EspG [Amycolatopsis sp. WQ 127309]|uniref:ESX secretion-associated protein EspG n=1 Tax=Amycolatopsis sp. WQ 127309 TaxID=2932773 RepID=UPI001FF3B515|nr:ESX secretion-associated protein EspG [Amycolatopsis sp. WQ 127309]UOZ03302.1 ESX secretion-associated protein EspG [Amycolatopsis sp. WQ 127309]